MTVVIRLVIASIWLDLGTQLNFDPPSGLQGCLMINGPKLAVKVHVPKMTKNSALS